MTRLHFHIDIQKITRHSAIGFSILNKHMHLPLADHRQDANLLIFTALDFQDSINSAIKQEPKLALIPSIVFALMKINFDFRGLQPFVMCFFRDLNMTSIYSRSLLLRALRVICNVCLSLSWH